LKRFGNSVVYSGSFGSILHGFQVLATIERFLREAGSAQITVDEHAGSEVTASASVSDNSNSRAEIRRRDLLFTTQETKEKETKRDKLDD
jgi:hypothetical protein